jgi:putative tryptophan/tyrosine transport system substrate-binding protein
MNIGMRHEATGNSKKLKVICFALCALLFALSFSASAQQQAKKVSVIGILRTDSPSIFAARNEVFRQGLRDLGYVEGKNIVTEYRYAEGKLDRLPDLAAELVRLKVDVIVTAATSGTHAAMQATSTIPIVVASAGDLVGQGLVASLAKPGGNVTGSTSLAPDLSGKRLELLKEIFPKAARVAVLLQPNPGDRDQLRETETAARQLGVKVQPLEIRDPNDFQNAYDAIAKQRADAIIIVQGAFTQNYRRQLAELALKHRLPAMCEQAEWAQDGCVASYGPDLLYLYRRAAIFVDKLLKGTKPADIPVEQPIKFEFIINLKAAKQIGLTIPPNVLARADKVIK